MNARAQYYAHAQTIVQSYVFSGKMQNVDFDYRLLCEGKWFELTGIINY